MNWFDKWVTKRNIVAGSCFLVLLSLIIDPYLLGLCLHDKQYCLLDSIAGSVGKPLFILSMTLCVGSIVIYWFKHEVFSVWRLVMGSWTIIAIAITFLTPEYGGGGIISIQRDSIAIDLSILFFAASFITIIAKSFFPPHD